LRQDVEDESPTVNSQTVTQSLHLVYLVYHFTDKKWCAKSIIMSLFIVSHGKFTAQFRLICSYYKRELRDPYYPVRSAKKLSSVFKMQNVVI